MKSRNKEVVSNGRHNFRIVLTGENDKKIGKKNISWWCMVWFDFFQFFSFSKMNNTLFFHWFIFCLWFSYFYFQYRWSIKKSMYICNLFPLNIHANNKMIFTTVMCIIYLDSTNLHCIYLSMETDSGHMLTFFFTFILWWSYIILFPATKIVNWCHRNKKKVYIMI